MELEEKEDYLLQIKTLWYSLQETNMELAFALMQGLNLYTEVLIPSVKPPRIFKHNQHPPKIKYVLLEETAPIGNYIQDTIKGFKQLSSWRHNLLIADYKNTLETVFGNFENIQMSKNVIENTALFQQKTNCFFLEIQGCTIIAPLCVENNNLKTLYINYCFGINYIRFGDCLKLKKLIINISPFDNYLDFWNNFNLNNFPNLKILKWSGVLHNLSIIGGLNAGNNLKNKTKTHALHLNYCTMTAPVRVEGNTLKTLVIYRCLGTSFIQFGHCPKLENIIVCVNTIENSLDFLNNLDANNLPNLKCLTIGGAIYNEKISREKGLKNEHFQADCLNLSHIAGLKKLKINGGNIQKLLLCNEQHTDIEIEHCTIDFLQCMSADIRLKKSTILEFVAGKDTNLHFEEEHNTCEYTYVNNEEAYAYSHLGITLDISAIFKKDYPITKFVVAQSPVYSFTRYKLGSIELGARKSRAVETIIKAKILANFKELRVELCDALLEYPYYILYEKVRKTKNSFYPNLPPFEDVYFDLNLSQKVTAVQTHESYDATAYKEPYRGWRHYNVFYDDDITEDGNWRDLIPSVYFEGIPINTEKDFLAWLQRDDVHYIQIGLQKKIGLSRFFSRGFFKKLKEHKERKNKEFKYKNNTWKNLRNQQWKENGLSYVRKTKFAERFRL